jgi:hypothetical protein
MPQIIVAADRGAAFGEGAVTFRERVNVSDFESEHFAAQLLERLGWAVGDADVVEQRQEESSDPGRVVERRREEPVDVDETEPVEDAEPVETRLEESIAGPVPA